MADGIVDAANAGADVINVSMTIGDSYSQTLLDAVRYAYAQNIPVFVSAGNNSNHMFPADFQETITVAASTIDDTYRTDSRPSERIDICAPGDSVPTTTTNNGYGYILRTSGATAHVTGVASLLLSIDQNLSIHDIREILHRTAVDINAWRGGDYIGWDRYLGWGRIDADAALEFILPPYDIDKFCQTGGYEWWTGPENETMFFMHNDEFSIGTYYVTAHAMNLDVTFPDLYAFPPIVWGDWGTKGTSYENPHGNTLPWCKVIQGTLTNSGCTLRTYYYDPVLNQQGQNVGRYPANAPRFCWTVVGIKDLAPPQVTVVEPNGGEIYDSKDEVEIRWYVQDEWLPGTRSYVLVGKELDDGTREFLAEWSNQSVNSDGYGSIMWTVPMGAPDTISTHFITVLTYDSNAHSEVDESNGFFTIRFKQKPADPGPPDPRQEAPVTDHIIPVVKADYLGEPYPNPFNPSTMITFGVAKSTNVSLHIYDIAGKKVSTIYQDESFEAGEYSVYWHGQTDSGATAANGIYFVKYIAGGFKKTTKITLLK